MDLSTGMVLSASAEQNTRQEALEDLCEAGVQMLNGPETVLVQHCLSAGGAGLGLSVVSHARAALRCFIRSPLVAEDALCLTCDAGSDCDGMLAAASAVLHAIGQEG